MTLHAGPRNSLAFLDMPIQCSWLPLVRSAASLARTACRNGRDLALARTGVALVRLRLGGTRRGRKVPRRQRRGAKTALRSAFR